MSNEKNSKDLVEALRSLLLKRKATTQESICTELENLGYDINQSKASRLLRKIGAIKVIDIHGNVVYSLPREPAPPSMNIPLRELILDIVHNETLIIIFTSPGSASMIARILDYHQIKTEILGTIAGDDTLFIAPKSINKIHALFKQIKMLLIEK